MTRLNLPPAGFLCEAREGRAGRSDGQIDVSLIALVLMLPGLLGSLRVSNHLMAVAGSGA